MAAPIRRRPLLNIDTHRKLEATVVVELVHSFVPPRGSLSGNDLLSPKIIDPMIWQDVIVLAKEGF
jgi:hypothetical protein